MPRGLRSACSPPLRSGNMRIETDVPGAKQVCPRGHRSSAGHYQLDSLLHLKVIQMAKLNYYTLIGTIIVILFFILLLVWGKATPVY